MKVYMVIAGYYSQNGDIDSLEVFSDEDEAHEYGEELIDQNGDFCFDFYEIKEREL
jgi:hypothetical protein